MKIHLRIYKYSNGFACIAQDGSKCLSLNGWTNTPHLFQSRGQILHKLSEILRDAGSDFYSSGHLPAGEYKRTRPRSKTRRKYGFYRRHKESLERSKTQE